MDLVQPVLMGGSVATETLSVQEFEEYFRTVLLFEYYAIEFN